MVRSAVLMLSLLAFAIAPSAVRAADDLYTAKAIVTGKGEKNRRLGFRDCLDRVLLRLTGDQRLLARPEVAAMRDGAGELVASFDYRDRLEGIPIHDEQGSNDRPHDLTCHFDRSRLDALVPRLGSRPWLAIRPTVVPGVVVERGGRRFVLTSDGGDGPFMDQSFAAAAAPLALPLALPASASLTQAGIDAATAWQAGPPSLDAVARSAGGGVALLGRLAWSDADLGWVADWRIAVDGKAYDWQVRGVSFDGAFRVAARGAAQVLSGNGQP